jgi:hypothetical protein
MDEKTLLTRITVNPAIFGGKPIIRGRRLAVEHVLAHEAIDHHPAKRTTENGARPRDPEPSRVVRRARITYRGAMLGPETFESYQGVKSSRDGLGMYVLDRMGKVIGFAPYVIGPDGEIAGFATMVPVSQASPQPPSGVRDGCEAMRSNRSPRPADAI